MTAKYLLLLLDNKLAEFVSTCLTIVQFPKHFSLRHLPSPPFVSHVFLKTYRKIFVAFKFFRCYNKCTQVLFNYTQRKREKQVPKFTFYFYK